MYRSRGYFQYVTLILILAPCLIQQVLSRKCYNCNSLNVTDCFNATNIKEYGVECKAPSRPTKNTIFPGVFGLLNISDKTEMEYECGIATGFSLDYEIPVIYRGCVPKFMTCETVIKKNAALFGAQINECKRCDSDLCNSSGHLKAGIWILILSLLTAYLFKM